MVLPGGFSPINAIKQVGSIINPTGGVTDYNVFSNLGRTRSTPDGGYSTGGTWDAPTNSMDGAMYYDAATGQVQQNSNGSWNPINTGSTGAVRTDVNAGSYNNNGLGTNDQFKFYRNQANNRLGQLDTSWGNTQRGLQQSFDTQGNELNTARMNATKRYGDTTTANQQQYQTNYNQVAQNGAQQLRGLLSYLASMGGSGGTNGQVVRNLVGQGVSQELGGAGQNYAQNEVQNETTYNNFLNEEQTNRQKLNDWYNNQRQNAEAQYNQTRKSLLDILKGLDNKSDSVANLGSALNSVNVPNEVFTTNQYTGVTPQYTAPALETYASQLPTEVNINTPQNNGRGTSMSYLNMLAKQRKDNVVA